MTKTNFNLATSIFFVGYLLMQLPSNLLLTRVKPTVYLATAMTLWGVISTTQSAVHSFGALVAARICLGFVEAPFFPGRAGLLGAGILENLDGAHGIAGWRWLFIVEGVITIGIAITAGFVLPDFPATVKWLDEEERAFAQWRLIHDAKEADNSKSTTMMEGLKLALRLPHVPLRPVPAHVLLSQTLQYFFLSIVNTLGYGHFETLLLTVPVWFATFLVSLLVTYTSGRTGD
ncbi:hypothetical protein VTN00DRAFT_8334 [Thermoascus crustaceus]|uniref:uncharacterized protein n=1 Tax=Thermoascus crustaceus TaxID=5088 RepID=UPI00374493AC